MAFLITLQLPNYSEIDIPLNEKELPPDFFPRLFENLAINFLYHGLDCILKEIKIVETETIIFKSVIPLRELKWAHTKAALFLNGVFIGKFGGPLYFPEEGWQHGTEFLANPPYWDILENEVPDSAKNSVSLIDGQLEYPIERMRSRVFSRLALFLDQSFRFGIQLNNCQLKLSDINFLQTLCSSNSKSTSKYETELFLQEICGAITETISDIINVQDQNILYHGFLTGPTKIMNVSLKWDFPIMDTLIAINSFKPLNLFEELDCPACIWARSHLGQIIEITDLDPQNRYHPSVIWKKLEAPYSYFVSNKTGWTIINDRVTCPDLQNLKTEIKRKVLSKKIFFNLKNLTFDFNQLPSELARKLSYLLNILEMAKLKNFSNLDSTLAETLSQIETSKNLEELQRIVFNLSLNSP